MATSSFSIARVIRALWRLVLMLAGLAFMAVLLVLGLFVGLGVYLWARLRGRPTSAGTFRWTNGPAGMPGWARGPGGARRPSPDDVVDVDVREVREAGTTPLPAPQRHD